MRVPIIRLVFTTGFLLCSALVTCAQDVRREFRMETGGTLEVTNRSGRVAVRAVPAIEGVSPAGTLSATAPGGVSESDIKVNSDGGRTSITVRSSAAQKRIDLTLSVPERTKVIIETGAGAIEAVGNFQSL